MKGKKSVESIGAMLKQGLDELFSGERYRDFLKMTARFPNYSYRNLILLLSQCPHATQVKGFRGWLAVGRAVRAGEKGIRIIAPFVKEDAKFEENIDDVDTDANVDVFRRISVFDISQTDGADSLPGISASPVQIAPFPFKTAVLNGDVPNFNELFAAIKKISPYPIHIENISGDRKGYCSYTKEIIAVRQGLSQLHTIKTCLHEIAHALLHRAVANKERKEIEAESIAFTVCQYFNLDTSEYSFNYIAGYSIGKECKEITAFLDTIQKAASYLIDSIEGELERTRIAYDNSELCVIANHKTAMRLYSQGALVYLIYPGRGEVFAMDKAQIQKHEGPYAVESSLWHNPLQIAV